MTCVIVEDEKLLAMVLEKMVKEEGLEVLGMAIDAEEAVRIIDDTKPDVVFLDINLGEHDGFYVLEHINYKPYVIFTTAYSEYAVKAFDENAVDYVLKPVTKERLRIAIEKVKRLKASQISESNERLLKVKETINKMRLEKVPIESGDEIVFLNSSDIIYLTSDEGETIVVTVNEKVRTKTPLKNFELRLPSEKFLRIHKSYIVNTEQIKKIIKNYFGSLAIETSNGDILPVGRNYKDNIKNLIG
ncbi:LytR/AlgR family response regulator transcription factor [Fervidobacterium sp.]